MSDPEPLRVCEDLWLLDTALYRADRHTLALADLHLGYEAALRRSGVSVPETSCQALLRALERTFAQVGVPLQALVLDGDLRHDFGPLHPEEWRELRALFDAVVPRCRRVIVIEGNHDPNLSPLARRYPNVEVVPQLEEGGWLYAHGDRLPELAEAVEAVVIGHEHPALSLVDPVTGRQERYKAFLRGTFRGRTLWVLPASNALIRGTDLAREGALSPLLGPGERGPFEVFLRDDRGRVLPFGPLQRLI